MIKSGDRVYLHISKTIRSCYRTVRSVSEAGVRIYSDKLIITVPHSQIIRVIKPLGDKIRGASKLSQLMHEYGIRNEDLADRSGYSIGTVDRARRGLMVKDYTLADLLLTVKTLRGEL